jgi:hypothetical protein
MNNKWYIITGSCCFALGILFFLIFGRYIIFQLPFVHAREYYANSIPSTLKQVSLHWWHTNTWKREAIENITAADKGQLIYYLLNRLMNQLHEDALLERQVSVQQVLLNHNHQEAYISFDGNPLGRQKNISQKIMIIESMVKTLRENNVALQSIHLLVHHQPLYDYHLDFSQPWPIAGIMK